MSHFTKLLLLLLLKFTNQNFVHVSSFVIQSVSLVHVTFLDFIILRKVYNYVKRAPMLVLFSNIILW